MSLRSLAREGTAKALRRSGAPRLLRWLHRRRCATLLLYHDPKPDVLEAHVAYLAARYAFTDLDTVVDALRSGDWSRVPDRALVVTLDDGHRGNYALLPVFRRHGVRPTIYLCSQVVATGRRFWFQQPGVDPAPYKPLRHAERLAALKRDLGYEPARVYPEEERQALSREEITEMAPYVDFQAHTRFHPVLTTCTEPEAFEEIAGSRGDLEALLGRPCRHFSYPNGDYLEREVELVRRAGFASARTIDAGWVRPGSDPLRLKVFGISDDASVDMLAAQLGGIPNYVRRLLQGEAGGRWPVIPPPA